MIVLTNCEGYPGIDEAVSRLGQGEDGLRAIIEGIKRVEADPRVRTVGYGGWPNLLGEVELDACVMDGDTLRTGAVGALKGFLHPVEVAFRVMRDLKHEILVGEGAALFAREIAALEGDNLIADAQKTWREMLEKAMTKEQRKRFPDLPLAALANGASDPERVRDTTVFLSRDETRKISAATSTSGWAWKYPGRLGDSPVIGAGAYADSRYGACACTHTGEMSIRCVSAHTVVMHLKMGASLEDAVYEAIADLQYLKEAYGAGVTIHAIDRDDNHKVVSLDCRGPVTYWVWKKDMSGPQQRQAEVITTV